MKVEVNIPDRLARLATRVMNLGFTDHSTVDALVVQALRDFLSIYDAVDFDALEQFGSCTTSATLRFTNDDRHSSAMHSCGIRTTGHSRSLNPKKKRRPLGWRRAGDAISGAANKCDGPSQNRRRSQDRRWLIANRTFSARTPSRF